MGVSGLRALPWSVCSWGFQYSKFVLGGALFNYFVLCFSTLVALLQGNICGINHGS